jgi:hypothetical protein
MTESTFKLKRSFGVKDLTKVPLETHLQTTLNVTIAFDTQNTSHGTTTYGAATKSATMTMTVDSFMPFIKVKKLLEPKAYNLYINLMEPESGETHGRIQAKTSKRNIDYFARSSSPILSPASDISHNSTSSGYASEDEYQGTVFPNDKSFFLSALRLESQGEVLNGQVYEHFTTGTGDLTCYIELDKLIHDPHDPLH